MNADSESSSIFICVHLRSSAALKTFSSAVGRANPRARGVTVQMLRVREGDDRGGVFCQALFGVLHHAAAFEELVDADAVGEPRGRIRRQAMARTGDVVPRRHR